MCKHGEETTILEIPAFTRMDERKTISVDSCIAATIQKLWDHGCKTSNCCCGHGRVVGGHELIIPEDQSPENLAKVCRVLSEVDPDHFWTVLQWKLVFVATVPPRESSGGSS